jgi:hypothetical protein
MTSRVKKVFISYDHSEDVHYRRLLQAWDANSNFAFEFDDRSPTVAIDSIDAAVVKAALTKKMIEADYLLVIVGEKTATSKWVTWEIDRAKKSDTKLCLVAVKISSQNVSPSGLLNTGTSWAQAFERDKILSALNQATNNY